MKRSRESSEPPLWIACPAHPSVYLYLPPAFLSHASALVSQQRLAVTGFDLDHTLMCPRSGKTFYNPQQEWKPMFPDGVLSAAFKRRAQSTALVIVSNQAGVSSGRTPLSRVQQRIGEFLDRFSSIPIACVLATEHDACRKPLPTMMHVILQAIRTQRGDETALALDTPASLFVGDAAGREAGWDTQHKRARDFSCADRCFARNLGIAFATPEAFFLNERETSSFSWRSPDWTTFSRVHWSAAEVAARQRFALPPVDSTGDRVDKHVTVVVAVGFPGAGKSTYLHRCLKPLGYTILARDELKTPAAMKARLSALVAEAPHPAIGIAIDATCGTKSARKVYLDAVRGLGARHRCLCLHLTSSRDVAEHLNMFRFLKTKDESQFVPRIALDTFASRFEAPVAEEGFEDVVAVPFELRHESEDEDLSMFYWFYHS